MDNNLGEKHCCVSSISCKNTRLDKTRYTKLRSYRSRSLHILEYRLAKVTNKNTPAINHLIRITRLHFVP